MSVFFFVFVLLFLLHTRLAKKSEWVVEKYREKPNKTDGKKNDDVSVVVVVVDEKTV